MQRIFLITVLAVAFAGVAVAGDYHWGDTLTCSQCHVMHASQSHGYDATGGGHYGDVVVGENTYLLRQEVNALCLSCHDGSSWVADVMGSHTGGYVRAGGGLNDGTDAAPYHNATGHTLGSTDVAPGGTFTNPDGLKCVDCHQQHGYGGYGGPANPWRNLYAGGGAFSYETGTVTGDHAVTQAAARDYSYDNLTFSRINAAQETSPYADFCKQCHTEFHGAVGGSEIEGSATGHFIRHPSTDVVIGAIGGGHSNSGVYAGHTNQVPTMTNGTDFTPSCFSCHKGHGNQNAFGLIFMDGDGAAITEEGDGGTSVKSLCGQCHVQG